MRLAPRVAHPDHVSCPSPRHHDRISGTHILSVGRALRAIRKPTIHPKRGMGDASVTPVLPVSWTTIRLFLHVTAATVWVGGQLTLAGLVPGLRRISRDAPRAAAQRFNGLAWAAFAVLVGTGIWNVAAVHPDWSSRYGRTLVVKLVVVALSGLAALLHARARSRRGLAAFGGLSGLTALGALFLGVLLAG